LSNNNIQQQFTNLANIAIEYDLFIFGDDEVCRHLSAKCAVEVYRLSMAKITAYATRAAQQ
jgi:hypothetical protein